MRKKIFLTSMSFMLALSVNAQSKAKKAKKAKNAKTTTSATSPSAAPTSNTNQASINCGEAVGFIKDLANACLSKSDFDQRGVCLDQAGKSYRQKYGESNACEQDLNALSKEVIAQENSKYKRSWLAEHEQNKGQNQNNNQGNNNSQNGNYANNQNGNYNGNQNGQNQSGNNQNGNQANINCTEAVGYIKDLANACLSKSDFNQRGVCLDQAGTSYRQKYGESNACEQDLDALKRDVIAQENSKYKRSWLAENENNKSQNQNNNQGNNNSQNGNYANNQNGNYNGNQNGNQANINCTEAVGYIKDLANACLSKSDFDQRGVCLDQAGTSYRQKYGESNACEQDLDVLKRDVIAQENSKYKRSWLAEHEQNKGQNQNNNQGNNNSQNGNYANNQNGNYNGNQNGQNQSGNNQNGNQANINCSEAVGFIKELANSCLTKSDFNQRGVCLDQAGTSFRQKFGDSNACEQDLDALKRDVIAQENSKYKRSWLAENENNKSQNNNQANNNSNNNNSNNQGNSQDHMAGNQMGDQSKIDCSVYFQEGKTKGQKCISIKDEKERAGCFNTVGAYLDQNTKGQCEESNAKLGNELVAIEKSKYNGTSILQTVMNGPNNGKESSGNNSNNSNSKNSPSESSSAKTSDSDKSSGTSDTRDVASLCQSPMNDLLKKYKTQCSKQKKAAAKNACREKLITSFNKSNNQCSDFVQANAKNFK